MIFKGMKEPGCHAINWNAGNVSAGIYIIKMEDGSFVRTKKCVLTKLNFFNKINFNKLKLIY